MGSKKRKPGGRRQGISGNPAVRTEQLAEERALRDSEPGSLLDSLGLDLDNTDEARELIDSLLSLSRTMAGGAEPAEWWPDSHERVLERARAADWPSDLAGIEETTCAIIGAQLRDNLSSRETGLHNTPWLRALAEHAGAVLSAALSGDADRDCSEDADLDWQPLWALLRGIILTAPLATPGDEDREDFPDIKFAHEVALAEGGKAAKLLEARGLPGGGWPVPEARPTGAPLVARDGYGCRFLVAAPFGYSGGETGHWYAWDVDACWITTVVAAGTFGSEAEALAEWREAVGAPASGAGFGPCAPEMAGLLLRDCLTSNVMMGIPQGDEPEELLREYYRYHRRAQALDAAGLASDESSRDGLPRAHGDLARRIRNEFRKWHAERHGKRVAEVSQAAETIIDVWGPRGMLGGDLFYGCSPHRVEYTAHLISDGYLEDYAVRALRVLPDWVQWCAERSGLSDEAARRPLAVARTAAEVAEAKGGDAIGDPTPEGGAFRRAE